MISSLLAPQLTYEHTVHTLDPAPAGQESGSTIYRIETCVCPACATAAAEYFVPPTGGTASNGKPVFDWDQAAIQLTRGDNSWSVTLGTPATVTYGFRAFAPSAMPSDTDGFSRFSAAQIQAAEASLRLWSDVANITFVRVGVGATGEAAYTSAASILFGNYATGAADAAAFAYLPSPSASGALRSEGDVWVNISLSSNQNLDPGAIGPHTLAHEIGHAIGLRHPSDYNGGSPVYADAAVYWQDARMFSVMSYFGSTNTGGSLNAFSAGPQLHDIAAAQRLYGANMTTRTSDTVYGFNSNTGLAHFTITLGGASPVFSIWDAGGTDTIDLSGYATASEIDLREEAFSSTGPGNGGVGIAVGNISIARGAVIENAIGGSGADTLIGNNVANQLTGGAGGDNLDGNGGIDSAVYASASNAATFARSGAGWVVTVNGDAADTLSDMEFLRFSDRVLALRPSEGSVDGNGTSDLLLRNTNTGAIALWLQNGSVTATASIVGVSDVSYAAVGQGDFDGDGRFDLLFRNAAGVIAQWRMDGTSILGVASYASDAAWSLSAIGDFDGDFRDDILFRSNDGLMAQWQMNGLNVSSVGVFATSDTSWSVASVADFNGDGRDDILWRNSAGLLATWAMNGFSVSSAAVFALSDPTWSIVGTGDFNGDLREDILWRSSGGVLAQWTMDGTSVTSVGTFAVSDTAWSVSDIGDYNGDGRDDILWQGPDGTFALWALNGFGVSSVGIIGNPGSGWTDIA
jgi:hypothetical protein